MYRRMKRVPALHVKEAVGPSDTQPTRLVSENGYLPQLFACVLFVDSVWCANFEKLVIARQLLNNEPVSTVSIKLPESVISVFGESADARGESILEAAVVKWFEMGRISQGKAAEILALSRSEFLDLLSRYRVSAWQYTEGELDEELGLD